MGFLTMLLSLALVVFIKMKMPMWKGKLSERFVYDKLLELPNEYVVFNDLLFCNNGRSTQIDHVVVSPYGVFVIETKGYKGWIVGGENSEYWTQIINKRRYKFYNPIMQNNGHVRYLRYLLKSSVDIPIIPIVVFNNAADLKVHAGSHIVVNRCDLIHSILQYKKTVLDQTTIYWVIKAIQQNHVVANKECIERHRDNVGIQVYRHEKLICGGICPRCRGRLVLRRGKWGSFYGCSNYPKCKFTVTPR